MKVTAIMRFGFAVAAVAAMTAPAGAGIPTVDAIGNILHGLNLSETTVTAGEAVAQTLKQVEQYRTQLEQYRTQIQQYENMVRNTAAPAAYIWNEAQTVMTQLRSATDTLSYYRNQAGSVDAYLAKFQDVNYYRTSPCYTATGCSEEEMAAQTQAAAALGSEAQKRANDAMLRGIDRQQEAIQTDAARLGQLQGNAQTADGQMQAIGYASQIASEQANQLLQIRGLLIAQQNAIATKMQADNDKAARDQAALDKLTTVRPTTPLSTSTGWSFQ